MKKIILFILIFQLSHLHAEFFYEELSRSSEYMTIFEKGLNTKEVKLQPEESDELVAVMRCNRGAIAGYLKYVDFLIYKNANDYSYLQIISTDKTRKKGTLYPLMGFAREDNDATLYFHNIIDMLNMVNAFARAGSNFDLSNPFLLKSLLQQWSAAQIKISPVTISAFIQIRTSLSSPAMFNYKSKNCNLIDKEPVKEALDYYYSLEVEEREKEKVDNVRQF